MRACLRSLDRVAGGSSRDGVSLGVILSALPAMQMLSAADAISPAIARTRLVLFTPFRAGRTWKFSATAYLAFAGTVFLPFPLIYLAFIPLLGDKLSHGLVTAITVAIACATLLFLYIFYLCSRIQFPFFEVVLNREQFIAPSWRKFGPQSFLWTAIKVVLGTVVSLLLAAPTGAFLRNFVSTMSGMHIVPGQPPPPEMMTQIFSLYAGMGLVYLYFGLFYLISSLLTDFIVPSLALENTSYSVAFGRLGQLLRREPGQVALYALLKLVLGIAGYMGLMIGFEIVAIFATLIVGLVVALVGFLLHLLHVPMIVLIVLGCLIAFAWYVALVGYGMVIGLGTFFTFFEAYGLYFLGGRYPMLGQLLDRSTPPSAPMPPPAAYASYPPPLAGPQ